MEITEQENDRLCQKMERISELEYHDCAGQRHFTQGYFGTSIMYGGAHRDRDSISWIFPERRDVHFFVRSVMLYVLGIDKTEEFTEKIQISQVGYMYVLTAEGLRYKHH